MPNYDYRCTSCGKMSEAFQKITDEPLVTCPNCQSNTLQRGPGGGIGLVFSGSGFYSTDYNPSTKPLDEPSPKKPGGSCSCGNTHTCG